MDPYDLFIISYVPKVPALLSFVSACSIVREILFCPLKRSNFYYRLLLCLNICSSIVSCCHFVGTWALPKYTSVAFSAIGNDLSCKIQGSLLTIFGYALQSYYAALTVTSYVAVLKNFKSKIFKHAELFIHLFSFIPPIIFTIIAIQNNYFNPSTAWCWVDSNPSDCARDPNVECVVEVNDDFIYILIGAGYINSATSVLMMILLYRKIKKDERSSEDLYQGNRDATKPKIMLVQVCLYILSYSSSYIIVFISRVMQWRTGSLYVPLYGAAIFLVALQGFFGMLAYALVKSSFPSISSINQPNPNVGDNTDIHTGFSVD